MVETITPVVYGGRVRWATALALHAVGAAMTAALFGAALGIAGRLLEAPWGRAGALALAAVAALYALGEVSRLTVAVPQLRRQVPDWWREYFSWPVAATLYGAGLGIGFFTYVSHGTLVAVSLAAFASGDPAFGAVVVGTFGLARGMSAARSASVHTQEDAQRLVDRLAGSPERRRSLANGVVLVVVAAVAAAVAVTSDDGWGSVATAGLASAFAWAAASKLLRVRAWRATLSAHAVPQGLERAATSLVPAAEMLVPVLIVAGRTRPAAAWAIALILVFTAESVRARRRAGRAVPCGCFGGLDPVPLSTVLARNAALAIVAIVVALRRPTEPLITWPGWPGPGEVVPAALVIIGLAVAGWTAWAGIRWLGGARA